MVSRYGVRIRKREEDVLKQQRATYECPRCGKASVRREGMAKWACRSCGAVFAGGAFALETTVGASAKKALAALREQQAKA